MEPLSLGACCRTLDHNDSIRLVSSWEAISTLHLLVMLDATLPHIPNRSSCARSQKLVQNALPEWLVSVSFATVACTTGLLQKIFEDRYQFRTLAVNDGRDLPLPGALIQPL